MNCETSDQQMRDVIEAWGRHAEPADSGGLASDGYDLSLNGVKVGIMADYHGCAHWVLSREKMGSRLAALAQSVIEGWPCAHTHYSWSRPGVPLIDHAHLNCGGRWPRVSELEPVGPKLWAGPRGVVGGA